MYVHVHAEYIPTYMGGRCITQSHLMPMPQWGRYRETASAALVVTRCRSGGKVRPGPSSLHRLLRFQVPPPPPLLFSSSPLFLLLAFFTLPPPTSSSLIFFFPSSSQSFRETLI